MSPDPAALRQWYLLEYDVVAGYVEKRARYRDAHLALARESADAGDLVLGGAAGDPVDRAVIVFHCRDEAAVRTFVASDPYVLNGLVKSWRISPWAVVVSEIGDAAR